MLIHISYHLILYPHTHTEKKKPKQNKKQKQLTFKSG